MAMITIEKTVDLKGNEVRTFECLRCGEVDGGEHAANNERSVRAAA